jgi:hypothetical protein
MLGLCCTFVLRLPLEGTKTKALDREIKGFLCIWWRIRDSNPGPADYDSVALTN